MWKQEQETTSTNMKQVRLSSALEGKRKRQTWAPLTEAMKFTLKLEVLLESQTLQYRGPGPYRNMEHWNIAGETMGVTVEEFVPAITRIPA